MVAPSRADPTHEFHMESGHRGGSDELTRLPPLTGTTAQIAGCVSLAGQFTLECLVLNDARHPAPASFAGGVQRQLQRFSWASLALAVSSGALRFIVAAAQISGQTLAAAASASAATHRFSMISKASVHILLAPGIVSSWYLCGSIPAPLGTPYGYLLLAKLTLCGVMLLVAAINRVRLTRRLDQPCAAPHAPVALRL